MYMFRTALSILHTAQWYGSCERPVHKALYVRLIFPLSGIAARLLIMAFYCLPESHAKKEQLTGVTAL